MLWFFLRVFSFSSIRVIYILNYVKNYNIFGNNFTILTTFINVQKDLSIQIDLDNKVVNKDIILFKKPI